MFLQVIGEGFAHGLVYGAAHLAVTEFGLGLSLKLGLCYLDRDDSYQAFAEVFTRHLYLGFLQRLGAVVVSILLEYTGQCGAESGFVRTALFGIDVVDV